MQGLGVQSLVGELRSHMSCGQKTKQKQKQYCNKFNKDFKSDPYQEQQQKKDLKKRFEWWQRADKLTYHKLIDLLSSTQQWQWMPF